jgi:tetratricopeptide (TPR) repeat protein
MVFDDFYFESEEEQREPYPEFFHVWDKYLTEGQSPKYYEPEELIEIIEIYLEENETGKAKKTMNHALEIYPNDDDLIYDLLSLLNDFEMWNDLLALSERYQDSPEVWADGHRLTALLHLGMEEDAFHFFRKLKAKYAAKHEDLSIVYQAMGEALAEMDLFNASINVMNEAFRILGEDADYYWIQLHSYVELNEKEKVEEIAEKITLISPFDSANWQRLGMVYLEIDDLEKAIEAFEFACNLGLDSKETLMNLIQTYERNSNFEKALEKVKEYINLYPDSYLVYIIAANICSQMEHWKDAISFLDQAIQRMPSVSVLYLYKSTYYLYMGEQRKAKSALEEGIKVTKDPERHLQRELEKLNEQYPD